MKVVSPSVTLLHHTPDPERVIERAGRVCWKSEDRTTGDSHASFIQMLKGKNHESVLEHASAGFLIVTDRGCCYSDDTEVLTYDGWKLFKDVTENDRFAGLTDDGALVWNTPSKVIQKRFVGNLLHFEAMCIDLLVTANHNMWVFDHDKRAKDQKVWKFIRADDLTNGRYNFTRTAKWTAPDAVVTIPAHPTKHKQFPAITLDADLTSDLFELLGLWVTDGSFNHGRGGGSSIVITQTKPDGVKRIKALCESLGFKCTAHGNGFRIGNIQLMTFVESLFGAGAKTFTASVPRIIKDASEHQIERFVAGVALGDGTIHPVHGHQVIYTSSRSFAGDLQELILKLGMSANIRTIRPSDRHWPSGRISACRESYVVSFVGSKRSTRSMLSRKSAKAFGKTVPYDGMVYCVTVPTHRLYVRRNGKPVWCGNSHEIVRHRLASYSQESTRYCAYDKGKFGGEITVVRPSGVDKANAQWTMAMLHAEEAYLGMIQRGAKPQEARAVLPTCLKTEIVMTANFREWRHFLRLRLSTAAHPDIRYIADLIRDELVRISPNVFSEWSEDENRSTSLL